MISLGSDLPFFHKTESVITITHEQEIISSKTHIRMIRPLLVGSYLQVTCWALGK